MKTAIYDIPKLLAHKFHFIWHGKWKWAAHWVAWPSSEPDFIVLWYIELGFLELRVVNRKWQRMS